jgi:hypothetical protein
MSKNKPSTHTIEQALFMYKETVSSQKEHLITILNQIPEKEKLQVKIPIRATRSPYIWMSIAELVTLCSLLIPIYPTYQDAQMAQIDPFYQVDKQVSQFEDQIDAEDLQLANQDLELL